jgi:hypothetical protein
MHLAIQQRHDFRQSPSTLARPVQQVEDVRQPHRRRKAFPHKVAERKKPATVLFEVVTKSPDTCRAGTAALAISKLPTV